MGAQVRQGEGSGSAAVGVFAARGCEHAELRRCRENCTITNKVRMCAGGEQAADGGRKGCTLSVSLP
jgi:hypothetical protein